MFTYFDTFSKVTFKSLKTIAAVYKITIHNTVPITNKSFEHNHIKLELFKKTVQTNLYEFVWLLFLISIVTTFNVRAHYFIFISFQNVRISMFILKR